MYVCKTCGYSILTIDRDVGTTPFLLMCKKEGCDGMIESSLYRVSQSYDASHEWYYPSDEEISTLDSATREHVELSGLLLRPIKKAEDVIKERQDAKAQG